MFIRFVVGSDNESHKLLTGVITEARILRDDGILDQHETEWLEETYAWLNKNLPCPPFSSSGWSWEASCWFKDDAGESIEKMWAIASLLREHGVQVRLLRSRSPGKILYEDKYQVVVEEWKNI
jgi:hypothetical protein